MTTLTRLWRRWHDCWFAPAAPTNLGVSRALFFAALAIYYIPHDFSIWGTVSPALWQPIWLFDQWHVPLLSSAAIGLVETIWKIALVLSSAGLYTRTSITIAAIGGTYLLGLPHNFGQTYHFDAVVVIAFWILACSRAGDAWSIDSLRRSGPRPTVSGEYRWPIQLILTALSMVFFAAGVAKIWTSGANWVLSDHMAFLLDRVQYHLSDADPWTNWGSYIARLPYAANLMALTTIVVETSYPLALVSRRLRLLMVPAGIMLILGIRLLMGPTFEQFLAMNLFWVPWDRLPAMAWVASVQRRLSPAPQRRSPVPAQATPRVAIGPLAEGSVDTGPSLGQ